MLFRLERKDPLSPDADQILGYEWLEVLAIVPVAIKDNDGQYGDWAKSLIATEWHCLSPNGYVCVIGDDVTIGDKDIPGEYTLASPAEENS